MKKKALKLICLFFITGCCASKPITKKDLTRGAHIPEKREFKENSSISPCENFHDFVCKEEEDKFQLPKDRSSWYFSFTDNSEKILLARKNFFKMISEGRPLEGVRIQQVKNFYLACMDTSQNIQSEKKYIDTKKTQILSIKNHQDLQREISLSLLKPDSLGIDFDTIPNNTDPNKNDIFIIPTISTLPEPTYYKNEKAIDDLRNLAEQFFKTIRLDNPKQRASHVIGFESGIAEQTPLPAEFRQIISSDTYKSKGYFSKKYSHIKWDSLFSKIPSNIQIRDLSPKALSYLNAQISEGDLESLKSVLLFHSLKNVIDDSSHEYRSLLTDFEYKYLRGPQVRPDRQERCTQFVSYGFSFEMDQYLSPILFPNFSEEKIIHLVDTVRNSILSSIQENNWLSAEAKAEALKKIKTARLFLVKPKNDSEWNFNPVQEYSKTDSIENVFQLKKALKERTLNELANPRERQKWDYSPLTLNAYYSPNDNKFVLLQGILQSPFYDSEFSDIENLAAIGSVIGHELGHAIDDNGSKYDSTGALRQWMNQQDLQEFKKRSEGFVSQFNKIGHNGQLTLGENIGDHVGISSSYKSAFLNNKTASINDKQHFFKAYAKMWCNKSTPAYDQNQIKTDPHSLGKERINQQVVHLDGFYEAFSCTEKDKMYIPPAQRIKIW